MGKCRSAKDIRTTGDIDDVLDSAGAQFIRQNGSHIVRRYKDTTFVYPDHGRNKEVSIGVRQQLIKLMLAAGIPVIILYVTWPHIVSALHLLGA